jgi:hypothetical protein
MTTTHQVILRYAVFQDGKLVAAFLIRGDARMYVKDMKEYFPDHSFEIREQV